jgi:hypothetical protein
VKKDLRAKALEEAAALCDRNADIYYAHRETALKAIGENDSPNDLHNMRRAVDFGRDGLTCNDLARQIRTLL